MAGACGTGSGLAPPQGFGVVRVESTGTSSYQLVYEHAYDPAPVRVLSLTVPEDHDCGDTLRPAVRHGRVSFRFFGARVPQTADHARSWMGHLLNNEVRSGRLLRHELVIPSWEALPEPLAQARGFASNTRQPSWLWHMWPPEEVDMDHVTLTMTISPYDGIALKLEANNVSAKAHVFRVLRQFCDECHPRDWHPLPDLTRQINKVHLGRVTAQEVKDKVVLNSKWGSRESITQVCRRTLNETTQVGKRVAEALLRAKLAAEDPVEVPEHLNIIREVDAALRASQEARHFLRPEWEPAAVAAVAALLARLLAEEDKDLQMLRDVREIAIRLHHEHGWDMPGSLADAEAVLGAPESPLRGEALILRRMVEKEEQERSRIEAEDRQQEPAGHVG